MWSSGLCADGLCRVALAGWWSLEGGQGARHLPAEQQLKEARPGGVVLPCDPACSLCLGRDGLSHVPRNTLQRPCRLGQQHTWAEPRPPYGEDKAHGSHLPLDLENSHSHLPLNPEKSHSPRIALRLSRLPCTVSLWLDREGAPGCRRRLCPACPGRGKRWGRACALRSAPPRASGRSQGEARWLW